ncbi:uncharacterized protein FIESC28_05707 [Fusarium coffeatum]|uniref:CFEM domain-containing protein n=1 Tax=Fusarium coffeatum TaxID=231269 RepID=A0A366RR02_9HYPO|nr:uncharacterized protein FIESC28_05707 [Fusarium coffeatum]RBR19242.1 hypothetical protein FIESC28_05707 [Fusarium coffeatum]
MKLFRGILACLVALPLALAALDHDSGLILGTLPSCAAKCLVNNVLQSTCGLDDVECTCTNEHLQAQIEKCVLAESPPVTKNTTMNLCGAPVRSEKAGFVVLNDVMGTLSGVFCLTRFVTKFAYKLPFGIDDLLMLITMLLSIPCICINSYGLAPNGIGTDIWTLTPDQITSFGRNFYALAVMYFLLQTTLKLTLVFFYLRIFPAAEFRRTLWGTVAFITAYGITFVLVAIFQCQPISYFWTKWDHGHEGKCASINAITWSSAAINIAMDFWILGLPLTQLRKMSLDWRKKIAIGLMFSAGIFVTIMSILRLYATIVAGRDPQNNVSWEYSPAIKWSTIETNVGIWCACMPTIRVLFVRLFPKILGETTRYINYGSSKGPNSRAPGKSGHQMSLGTTSKVDRAPHGKISPSGIVCDRTYDVEYADNDEAYLVHMKELNLPIHGTRSGAESSESL